MNNLSSFWWCQHLATLWIGEKLPAPGTAGSLIALMCVIFLPPPLIFPALLILIATFTVLGTHAVSVYLTKHPNESDPQTIIIDECVGQWITLLVCTHHPAWMWTGFVLFRFLDIVKPGFIGAIDKMEAKTPFGKSLIVMGDDITAGMVGAGILLLIQFFLSP